MSQLERIQEQVRRSNVDAVLLLSPENRFFATGFESSDGAVLITAEKGYLFTDFRYIEAAEKTAADYEIHMITREKGYIAWLNELFADNKIEKVGFEEQYMTVAMFNRYHKMLKAEYHPASNLFVTLRASKQEEELRQIQRSQDITDEAFSAIIKEIHPGMTEKELTAKLTYMLLHFGAQQMAFEPIVVSGVNSSMPHGVPSEKIIEKGDFVTMDFGARQSGYCADMTRTVAVGYATDEMKNIYNIVLEAQLAGIRVARAGIEGHLIHEAGAAVIEKAGYGPYFGHGFGHGLGIEVHENPGAVASSTDILPVGQVISAEPGIYLPGKFGVRIEDIIYLTENGNIDLAHSPKDLIII